MTDDELFAAFMAGFNASAEGFNGEYGGNEYSYGPGFNENMRRRFDDWKRNRTREVEPA
jgi:hypothetical protein